MTNVRPMTEIEQSIIQNILKLLVDNLKESWRQVYAIEFAVTATETHPHMIQITAPNEMVIHFQFQVRMRETLAKNAPGDTDTRAGTDHSHLRSRGVQP